MKIPLLRIALIAVLAFGCPIALPLIGCDNDSNGDSGADADGDTDSDSDVDASGDGDADSDGDVGSDAGDAARSHFNAEERRGAADAFIEALDVAGYEVREGFMYFFQIADCQDLRHCYGNNPTSPYGLYALPSLPDEFVDDDAVIHTDQGDVQLAFRLRPDEALVFFGRTPPQAEYFGLTHYLFDRAGDSGPRRDLFASLGDTINPTNIAVDSDGTYDDAFDKDAVAVTTADRNASEAIGAAMEAAGVSPDIMNHQVFPSENLEMGLDEEADTFNMLFRMAIFDDAEAKRAYQSEPPILIFRVTPRSEQDIDPLPRPERAVRAIGETEEQYGDSLDDLEDAIREAHEGITALNNDSAIVPIFGDVCVEEGSNCLADNADAAYLRNVPARLLRDDEFFVVFGINHMNAGRARYSSVSVYYLRELMGVASFDSIRDMPGSADVYLPDHPDRDLLYALTVRRSCLDQDYCLEVRSDDLGVPEDAFPVFVARAYLQPGLTVGPDPEELLLPRVLKVNP